MHQAKRASVPQQSAPPMSTLISRRPIARFRCVFPTTVILGKISLGRGKKLPPASSWASQRPCVLRFWLLQHRRLFSIRGSNAPATRTALPISSSAALHFPNYQFLSSTKHIRRSSSGGESREDIYTLPNLLTATRLLVAPVVGFLVLHDVHSWAFGLLVFAGLTDVLDGWIARRFNRKTVVGTVIDPMADKALMTILTACLASKGALPCWLASIIIGRDLCLGGAAFYFRYTSLPLPKTLARFWDFSLPSAEVRPTLISKYNTFLQLALVGVTTALPILPIDFTWAPPLLQYIVAITTIWSGASYIFNKDAIKVL